MIEGNPFMPPLETPPVPSKPTYDDGHHERLAYGLAMIAAEDVRMGDKVTVTWGVDPAYGGGIRSHTGIVTRLDSWIYVDESDRSPGHLWLPVAGMLSCKVEKIEIPADNPFMTAT